LNIFLLNIHKFLKPQNLDYGVFVGKKNVQVLQIIPFENIVCNKHFLVEQAGSETFNKAMMMNIASTEALKAYDYQVIKEDINIIFPCQDMLRVVSYTL